MHEREEEEVKEGKQSFCQPTRRLSCANHGNDVENDQECISPVI